MRTIILPPYAPILMESTRAIGYTIEAAIADIIDNSLSAKATHISIDFFPINESYISLLDDGYGMSPDILINSMQYGSKNPLEIREKSDLGRYGLGLKTASLSQCRKLIVISKQKNIISGVSWDLDYITKTKNWSLQIMENNEYSNLPNYSKLLALTNGTLVIWQNLDKFAVGENDIASAFANKTNLIREHIALVFHRYISGEPGLKKVEIRMNNRVVEPKDPFMITKSTQLMDEEYIYVRDAKVSIKPYILPHTSRLTKKELDSLGGKEGLRKNQGFYVYRNRRLLIWGTWFRLLRKGDLSKLARVQVDIPNSLDDLWTLDIKKSIAIPPEDVCNNLTYILKNISECSKRTWTHRSKKEIADYGIHIWNQMRLRNGEKEYEINLDYPLIQEVIHRYPEIKCDIEILLKLIQRNLPLNSLYLDLTSDEKIINDNEIDKKDIIKTLDEILSGCKTNEERSLLYSKLISSDPFFNYKNDITRAIKKGEIKI